MKQENKWGKRSAPSAFWKVYMLTNVSNDFKKEWLFKAQITFRFIALILKWYESLWIFCSNYKDFIYKRYRVLLTCRQTIPLWLSYVDFTFTIRHQGEIDAFLHHLNEENADKNLSEKPKRTVDFLNKNFLTSRDENTQRSVFRSAQHHTKPDYKKSSERHATSLHLARQLIRQKQIP